MELAISELNMVLDKARVECVKEKLKGSEWICRELGKVASSWKTDSRFRNEAFAIEAVYFVERTLAVTVCLDFGKGSNIAKEISRAIAKVESYIATFSTQTNILDPKKNDIQRDYRNWMSEYSFRNDPSFAKRVKKNRKVRFAV